MRASLFFLVVLVAAALLSLASAGIKEDGQKWLEEVATQDGVTQLPSGLLYRVDETGSGAYPTRESRVQVHYRGTLQDGTTFDASYDRGTPATFGVTQVIKGWTEALLLMREGDKCQHRHTSHTSTPTAVAASERFQSGCTISLTFVRRSAARLRHRASVDPERAGIWQPRCRWSDQA